MRDHLVRDWDLQYVLSDLSVTPITHPFHRGRKLILHDRPPAHFHSASPSEVHGVRPFAFPFRSI